MYTRLYRRGNFVPLSTESTFECEEPTIPRNIATYGPPRTKVEPWVRDERLANPLTASTVETSKNVEDKEEKATKEELSKEIHVISVDLNIDDNAIKHRTDQYALTQSRKDQDGKTIPPELVIRRGQSFGIKINFNQPFSRDSHPLQLVMMTGKFPKPSDFTLVQLEPLKSAKIKHGWKCQIKEIKGTSVILDITPSSSCVIGEWSLSIMTLPSDKSSEKAYCYEVPEDINILLNPWCKDDTVYLSDEKLLEEYILNDKGVVYCGNYRQIGGRAWNFGQFEEGILEICFHLLRRAHGNTVNAKGMSDPIQISRTISKILNCQDDDGVLVGNWSGDYSGGRKPTHWSGSPKILRQYEKNDGDPVCFGQCWVFSGLVTTVCRALGMPARSVTNFSSAHDTDCSLTIDTVMRKNEDGDMDRVPELSADSVWNFHVWNEVWMSRKDLGNDLDGWQAIDATPQELSGNVYCCGPTSIAAVKKGECSLNYDTTFVFAEVNADKMIWQVLEDDKWQLLYSDTDDVGRCISTKIADGKPFSASLGVGAEKCREDITDNYKYKEGTLEERMAVTRASTMSKNDRKLLKPMNKDIKLSLMDEDGIMVGENFTVKVKLTKLCEEKRTIASLTIDVFTKRYTGEIVSKVTSHSFKDIVLAGKSKEEQTISHEVKGEIYIPSLIEQCAMEIRVSALVKETGAMYMKTDDFRLRRPDLSFEVPKVVKKGVPFDLTVSFMNSLPHPLTECSLDLDGVVEDEEVKIPDVPASSEWKHVVKVTVNRSGRHQISGSFDSKELVDISGYLNLTLQE